MLIPQRMTFSFPSQTNGRIEKHTECRMDEGTNGRTDGRTVRLISGRTNRANRLAIVKTWTLFLNRNRNGLGPAILPLSRKRSKYVISFFGPLKNRDFWECWNPYRAEWNLRQNTQYRSWSSGSNETMQNVLASTVSLKIGFENKGNFRLGFFYPIRMKFGMGGMEA